MIGFETIGNATCTVFDGSPVLTTDPWISSSAYFGSWGMPYEIPEEQRNNLKKCKYVWVSHGHPDHLDSQSLLEFKDKTILLPDHVGGRIAQGLRGKGFNVEVLPDRKWVELSPNVKVFCIGDYYQDAVLLIDVKGSLLVNLNDCMDRGWLRTVRKIIKQYKNSFLLKLFGWGDVDMNNFYYEDGSRIQTLKKFPVGEQINYWADFYGVNHVVPFSSTHYYQRKDSLWGNEFVCSYDDYYDGLKEKNFRLLKPFIKFNLETFEFEEINPKKFENLIKDPSEFGDNWDETLSTSESEKVISYFKKIETLKNYVDYIHLNVGGKITQVNFAKNNFQKGITFDVPRGSLMTCVDFEVFDDLFIGNYMKTTLNGITVNDFQRQVSPTIGKYADNGLAKSEEELQQYFEDYKKRSYLEFIIHQFESESERRFRSFFSNDSTIFNLTKKAYKIIKRT